MWSAYYQNMNAYTDKKKDHVNIYIDGKKLGKLALKLSRIFITISSVSNST